MRRYLWLIILVVVIGLLIGYRTQVSSVTETAPVAPSHAKRNGQGTPLLPFDRTKVVSLEFHHSRTPAIIIMRQGNGKWVLEFPFKAPADTYLVERSLMALNFTTAAGPAPESGAEAAQFGLGKENAATKVVIRTEQGDLWLELGGASPNGAMRYARTSERSDVVLIDKGHVRGFPKTADEVLDKRVFPLADEPLSGIDIKEGTTSFALQAGDKRWSFALPSRGATDVQAMTEWLKRVAAIAADAVRSAEEITDPKSTPLIGSLRMTAGRMTVTTDLYRAGEQVIARRSDQPHLQYVMSAALLPLIFPDPFAIRDKHLLDAAIDAIAVVEMRQHGAPLRLTRTTAGWTSNGRRLPEGSAGAMESWVKELQQAQGIELIPALERCGMKDPSRWDVTLRGYEGQILGRVKFARTSACGDVGTLPSGEWIRLQNTGLIDRMPASRFS